MSASNTGTSWLRLTRNRHSPEEAIWVSQVRRGLIVNGEPTAQRRSPWHQQPNYVFKRTYVL
jgi:hypothetical protein